MHLSEFVDRLDDRLEHDAYADVDASANGLQVGHSDAMGEVEHVAFAVDAVAATFEAAAEAGADVLLTHHGVVWGGLDRVTGMAYDRVAALVEDGLALYVSHLPLDGHDEFGNAVGLAEFLDCEVVGPFGDHGGVTVGQRVRAREPYTVEGLRERLGDLDTGDGRVRALEFGPDEVEDLAIVTGAGVDWIREAADAGVEALVTGEGKGKAYHEAREAGLNVLLVGHYATETFGVRAVQSLVEGWGLETTYVDHPTGL